MGVVPLPPSPWEIFDITQKWRAPGATPHSSRATAGPGRDPSAVASGRSISPASIGQPRRPNSSVQTPHAGYRTSHGTHEGSHGGVDLRSGTRSPGEQTAATRRGSDRRRPRSTARGAVPHGATARSTRSSTRPSSSSEPSPASRSLSPFRPFSSSSPRRTFGDILFVGGHEAIPPVRCAPPTPVLCPRFSILCRFCSIMLYEIDNASFTA